MHLDSYDHSWRTDVLEKNSASYRSKIRDWSAAIDFDYEPLPSHRIKFGSSYTYHTFSPETSGSFFTEEGKDGKVNRSGGYSSPVIPSTHTRPWLMPRTTGGFCHHLPSMPVGLCQCSMSETSRTSRFNRVSRCAGKFCPTWH